MSTIKIKTPAMPEPDGPWHWKNIKTGKSGLYEEDPRKFGINIEHPDYQWKRLPSAAQLAARDAQWQEIAGQLLEIAERAKRLVEHADFKLGGCLSANSKASEIPSNAASSVKARHLASLRDSLAALSAITEE